MQNYHSSNKRESKQYDDVFHSIDMVQIIQKSKPNKKENANKLKKRLAEIQAQSNVAETLLNQSKQFEMPDEIEERKKSYAEAKNSKKFCFTSSSLVWSILN